MICYLMGIKYKKILYATHDLDLPKYKKYLEGIAWCISNYTTGCCQSYQYIYDSELDSDQTIHPWGMVMTVIGVDNLLIKPSDPINIDVYALLLIPEYASSYLDHNKKKIYQKVIDKFPIIYEEEKCVECKENYSENSTKQDSISWIFFNESIGCFFLCFIDFLPIIAFNLFNSFN